MTDKKDTSPHTRRAVMRAGAGLLGTGVIAAASLAVSATPARAQAAQKLAQSAVMYQNHPNNGQLCSICANFQAPNGCALVQGPINPVGWCVAFAPKAS